MVKVRYKIHGSYWRKTFDTVELYEAWRKTVGKIEVVEYVVNE